MSLLDFNIRRLQAQRACLNQAAELIWDVPGPVFELGLGNGRSFDHLREILPDREIFVFEREVAAHPDCIPDRAHLIRGDLRYTLPAAVARFAGAVALVHADVGSADPVRDARLAAFLAEHLPTLVRPGGVVVADRDASFAGAEPLPLPDGFPAGTYFLYRVDGTDPGS